MLSTPVRAGWWLASLAAHAVIWAAAGHGAGDSSEAQSAAAAEVAFDVIPDEPVAVVEPQGGEAPTRPRSAPGSAAPPTHVHSYPVAADHDARPHDPSIVHVPIAGSALPEVPPRVVPVRFAMTVISSGGQPGSATEIGGSVAAAGSGGFPHEEVPTPEGDVSVPARLASSLAPAYPPAAREEGAEADVVLAIVVTSTGTVSEAAVATESRRTPAFGFEEAALRALRNARFTPAKRNGKPVAVRMRWTVSFRLR